VFDADNHMYEPQEALTKYPPGQPQAGHRLRRGARAAPRSWCVATSASTSPNPTFEVVAKPGAQEDYFRNGAHGQDLPRDPGRADEGDPRIPEPGARLEVMDELGIDYALMFPTLGPAWSKNA